jgi:hypothetical protein
MSRGGTSLVEREGVVPRGQVGACGMGIADGIFWLGGTHLRLVKIWAASSIMLSWEDNVFDTWGVNGLWRGVITGAGG